jgi:hypothetical protein
MERIFLSQSKNLVFQNILINFHANRFKNINLQVNLNIMSYFENFIDFKKFYIQFFQLDCFPQDPRLLPRYYLHLFDILFFVTITSLFYLPNYFIIFVNYFC